jgi:hypothetical protein
VRLDADAIGWSLLSDIIDIFAMSDWSLRSDSVCNLCVNCLFRVSIFNKMQFINFNKHKISTLSVLF